MLNRSLLTSALVLIFAGHALAAERTTPSWPAAKRPAAAQQPAPRAACPSPDGPQPDGAIRCEMCPAAPGSRVLYRPMACSNGKWIEAGPCADGDCGGRTY